MITTDNGYKVLNFIFRSNICVLKYTNIRSKDYTEANRRENFPVIHISE